VRRLRPLRNPDLPLNTRVLILFAAGAGAWLVGPLGVGLGFGLPFAAVAVLPPALGYAVYLAMVARMRAGLRLGGYHHGAARVGSQAGAVVVGLLVAVVTGLLVFPVLVVLGGWALVHPQLWPVGLAALVGSWVVLVRRQLALHSTVVGLHADSWHPGNAPAVPAAVEELLADLAGRERDGNVSYFHGADPFHPHGSCVDAWTVPVVLRTEDGAAAPELTVAAVVRRIRAALEALGGADLPMPRRLPGLRVRERAYASGVLVGPDPHWLPDPGRPPVSSVPDWLLAAVRDDAAGIARHYLCLEVGGWAEDVVVTVPVHVSLVGRQLHLEFWAFVLPPVHPVYRQADWLLPRLPVAAAAWRASLRWGPEVVAAARAVPRLAADLRRRWSVADDVATAIAYRRPVQHGARVSLRRDVARARDAADARGTDGRSPSLLTAAEAYEQSLAGYDQLFQYADVQRVCRTAEKQVLDAVLALLAEHGLDGSDFRAFRASRITVTNIGGSIAIGAIGTGASGTGTVSAQPVPGS
jgi:hypothetical protein